MYTQTGFFGAPPVDATSLRNASRRGATIISFNPFRERALDFEYRKVEFADASKRAEQVQATAAALREAQIEPGGARALRLFS